MNKKDLIYWLESIGAKYKDVSEERGFDTVFIYGEKDGDYTPYIRVSWENAGDYDYYTRWNGYCSGMMHDQLKEIVESGQI